MVISTYKKYGRLYKDTFDGNMYEKYIYFESIKSYRQILWLSKDAFICQGMFCDRKHELLKYEINGEHGFFDINREADKAFIDYLITFYPSLKYAVPKLVDLKVTHWREHAVALRQCLMSCRYWDNKNSVIVFISKGGKPNASAEITPRGLRQFYGDESNRVDMEPTDECKKLIHDYMETYKFF